jgi:hypothetical protein
MNSITWRVHFAQVMFGKVTEVVNMIVPVAIWCGHRLSASTGKTGGFS